MECAVCYGEAGPFQKLCCGHTFCTGCVKTWYLKGTGTGCPMCRAPIYFRGFHKVRDEWDEEAWETRCSEVLGEAIDACIAEAFEMAETFPPEFKEHILADITDDIGDLEKTFRFLKAENIASEDIAYVLMDTMDYYSDRHMNKVRWLDEPPKEWITRYPGHCDRQRCGKRARAFMDDWVTLSLVVLI
jgi:hypothetical protein